MPLVPFVTLVIDCCTVSPTVNDPLLNDHAETGNSVRSPALVPTLAALKNIGVNVPPDARSVITCDVSNVPLPVISIEMFPLVFARKVPDTVPLLVTCCTASPSARFPTLCHPPVVGCVVIASPATPTFVVGDPSDPSEIRNVKTPAPFTDKFVNCPVPLCSCIFLVPLSIPPTGPAKVSVTAVLLFVTVFPLESTAATVNPNFDPAV